MQSAMKQFLFYEGRCASECISSTTISNLSSICSLDEINVITLHRLHYRYYKVRLYYKLKVNVFVILQGCDCQLWIIKVVCASTEVKWKLTEPPAGHMYNSGFILTPQEKCFTTSPCKTDIKRYGVTFKLGRAIQHFTDNIYTYYVIS